MAVKLESFQIQSSFTVAAVYLLLVLGGLVSSTGSGLACPDWPLCQGQILPTLSPPVLIEFTHRLWTMIVTIFVTGTMLLAWRKYKWPSRIARFSTLTFLLLLGQVILGMLTVRSGTEPAVVTAHLALGTMVFASALTTSTISLVVPEEGRRVK